FSRTELQGTAYLRSANQLMRDTINDWILSQNAMRGLDTNNEALAANTTAINADLAALSALDAQYGTTPGTTADLATVQDAWRTMSALPQTIDRQILYRPFLLNIESLIATVGDRSGLVLDSELDTHYTMQAILADLPKAQSILANLTVLGDSVVGSRNMSEDEKALLNSLSIQLIDLYDDMKRDSKVAFASNPLGNLKPNIETHLADASSASSSLVDKLISDVLSAPLMLLPVDAWVEQARGALTASNVLWDAQVNQLDTLLVARTSSAESTRSMVLAATAAVLLLVVYMWIGFYLAVMKTAAHIEQATALLAKGSVSNITLDNNDELSRRVTSTFSQMASATKGMTDTIAERTTELTEVSTLLAYMHDGVIITGADGNIKVLNPAATKILGVGFGEAVSKPLSSLILDPRFHETMATALAAPRQRHVIDVALNNRIVSVSAIFAPISQDVYEGMLILEDVTELRTLQHLQNAHRTSPVR
ncbi:MAG: PAS domain-containing protein, partial [Chloroflexia bacterium]